MPAAKKPKSSKVSEDQYTDPDLRDRIKAEVMAGDKGGKPGQWSARKAQLVANEYEKQGGAYKHPRSETQEHLHEWTGEHWKTADGKPAIRDGETKRYLPERRGRSSLIVRKRRPTSKRPRDRSKGSSSFPTLKRPPRPGER